MEKKVESFEQVAQRRAYEKYGVMLPLWFFSKYNNIPEALEDAEKVINKKVKI